MGIAVRIAVGVTMGIAVEVAVEIATEVAMGIIEANVDFFFQIKSQKSTNSPFLVAVKRTPKGRVGTGRILLSAFWRGRR